MPARFLHQLLCHRAVVEPVPTVLGNGLNGARQILLTDLIADARRLAVLQENPGGVRVAVQGSRHVHSQAMVAGRHLEAFFGVTYCRRQRAAQRQATVVFGQVHQRCRQTGNARGQRALHGGILDHVVLLVAVHALVRQ